jgi:SAM-dependent methyltransferase
VVCALALTHVPDLAPVLAEFARVLRPGGHLVISDPSGPPGGYLGSPVIKPLPGGRFGYLPHHNHRASDYLAAAIPLGLQVRRCEEPSMQYAVFGPDVTPASGPVPAYRPDDHWSLQPRCPEATNAAYRDTPLVIIWHFQLSGERRPGLARRRGPQRRPGQRPAW